MKTKSFLLFILLLVYSIAHSQLVTNANDNGPGSLRQAILDASNGAILDLSSLSGTILLTSGQLEIDKDITIMGPGPKLLTISGNNTSRIIKTSSSEVDLTLKDLTLSDGFTEETCVDLSCTDDLGTAIYSVGVLTIKGCVINNCQGYGAAIFHGGIKEFTINNSTISNNSCFSSQHASAIETYGGFNMRVQNSTISGNLGKNNLGYTVVNHYFANTGVEPTMFINTTISGNTGIGLYISGVTNIPLAVVRNSTVLDGINANNGNLIASNSILSGKLSNVESQGYNLIEVDTEGSFTAEGDVAGSTAYPLDLKLGPLSDNGGLTLTHPLLEGSPAINAGNNTDAPATDQRGFPRIVNDIIDIGSFESKLYDIDGDGITDQYDSCPDGETAWTSDPTTDIDGDGCRDSTEDNDDDNDGILDVDDNCPLTANPDQSDFDGDGIGDVCDICSQYFHTVWEGTLGQDHMNINIFEAKLDGFDLAVGDEIGVFDGNTCVGFGKLTKTIDQQNILSIKVSKNDGSGNGYIEGHEISYILWECATGSEVEATDIQCFNNQLTPVTCLPFEAGATAYVKLSAVSTICQKVKFRTGWNIFSVPNQPIQPDMETNFDGLIEASSLIKIQDEGGNSLEDWGVFGGWTNNIGNIYPTEGYKIKVGFADSIYICGSPVKYPFAIPLQAGWNIMGYPQTTAYEGMDGIVKQLIDRGTMEKVQDEAGSSIEDWGVFGGWTNNIGNFVPGEGYKIKVNSDDTLWIYSSYPKSTATLPELPATTHFQPEFEGNGVDHMNINLVGLPVNILKTGDELAVFDGMTCVGAVTIIPNHLNSQTVSIAASANDNFGMGGFAEGNPITLKLWNSKNNQEYNLEPEIVKGTSTFIKLETTVASLEKYATTGLEGITGSYSTEINCYPNPFSDEVTIEINLAEDAQVEVEVLNQLGEKVKFLTTKKLFNAGVHQLIWNGRNDNNSRVAYGIYHLRVTINGKKILKKLISNHK